MQLTTFSLIDTINTIEIGKSYYKYLNKLLVSNFKFPISK